MRKDAADRYGTAEALAQDLRRLVRGDAIEARRQTGWERVARWLGRRRITLTITVAFLALLGALAWIAHARSVAERDARAARYEPELLAAISGVFFGRHVLRREAEHLALRETPDDSMHGRYREVRREDLEVLVSAEARSLQRTLSTLKKLTRGLPDRLDGHYYLARACLLLGLEEDAARAIDRALEIDPEFLPARALSRELRDLGVSLDHPPPSRLEARPGWESWWLEAYERRRAHAWSEAARAYGALIDLEDEPYVGCRLEAYLARGICYLNTRDFIRAQMDLAVVRSIASTAETILLFAKALYLGGQEKLANETLDDAFTKWPPDSKDEFALWTTGLYVYLKDYETGLRWAQLAGKRRASLVATSLLRLGRMDDAALASREAIRQDPLDARAHFVLGLALLRSPSSGEREPAALSELLRVSTRAVALDPHDSFAMELLEVATSLAAGDEEAAGESGPQRPGLAGRFGDVKEVGNVNSPHFDIQPTLSPDGQELCFGSDRPAGKGGWDLYVAVRLEPNGPFGMPELLEECSSAWDDVGPTHSSDGLSLYFHSDRPGGSGGLDLYVAERPSLDEPFGEARNLLAINSIGHDRTASVTADGLELYFHSSRGGGEGVYVATRHSVAEDFGEVRRLREMPLGARSPSISADGLTLIWDGSTPFGQAQSPGVSDLWFASRATRTDESGRATAFGPAANVGRPVNSVFGELHPAFSFDWPAAGCELFFVRCLPGCLSTDIYQATWYPAARFVRGDCDGDGAVDVSDSLCILSWLFRGGPPPARLDMSDVNGDGWITAADALYLLQHLVFGRSAPVRSMPDCEAGRIGSVQSESDG